MSPNHTSSLTENISDLLNHKGVRACLQSHPRTIPTMVLPAPTPTPSPSSSHLRDVRNDNAKGSNTHNPVPIPVSYLYGPYTSLSTQGAYVYLAFPARTRFKTKTAAQRAVERAMEHDPMSLVFLDEVGVRWQCWVYGVMGEEEEGEWKEADDDEEEDEEEDNGFGGCMKRRGVGRALVDTHSNRHSSDGNGHGSLREDFMYQERNGDADTNISADHMGDRTAKVRDQVERRRALQRLTSPDNFVKRRDGEVQQAGDGVREGLTCCGRLEDDEWEWL